jgi:hypothetical protein
VFGAPLEVVSAGAPVQGVVSVRLGRATVCPYAGRRHASNNVYLGVNELLQTAAVTCFDEECGAKYHASTVYVTGGALPGQDTNSHDAVFRETLHTQQHNVQWDEEYDEPAMRPLPLVDFATVRANMGVGKTKAIVELLRREFKRKSKVLVVSYSRALCSKYKATFDAELPQMDFVNYLSVTGAITANCVIVCLDSLERVMTRNFDFFIVDEAASVLSHFNSPLMRNTCSITSLFELLCLQAKHVYVLDAVADSTAVRAVVDYVCRHKGAATYDIWNRHVRPTNRAVTLHVCDPSTAPMVAEQTLMHAALRRIGELLDADKNVVVPTSTKSFAKVLEVFLSERYPDLPRKIYHSGTESVRLATIDVDWPELRVLAYSPSISAGVSFELEHFDACVAYYVSSSHTPGVDIALQQLYRVRGLTDGGMSLFVHVVPPQAQLPVTASAIGAMLTTDLALLKRFGTNVPLAYEPPTRIADERVSYDPERLSYLIILGIILGQNRSAVAYVPLLRETLAGDYRVPVETRVLQALTKDTFDLDIAQLRSAAKAEGVVFADVRCMTDVEFDALKERLNEASDAERASARMHVVRTLWGVDAARIDEAFYREYVLKSSAAELYYEVKRLRDVQQYAYGENSQRMAEKLASMLCSADANMALFKGKSKEHYAKLLILQQVLEALLDEEQLEALFRYEHVQFGEAEMERALAACLQSANVEERGQMDKLFGIKGVGDFTAFRSIVGKGGGLTVERKATNPKRPMYKILSMGADKEKKLVATYAPSCPWM